MANQPKVIQLSKHKDTVAKGCNIRRFIHKQSVKVMEGFKILAKSRLESTSISILTYSNT